MGNAMLNVRLKQYLEAENTILIAGQSYRIGNMTLTRADLPYVQKEIRSLISAGATVDENADGVNKRIRHVRFLE